MYTDEIELGMDEDPSWDWDELKGEYVKARSASEGMSRLEAKKRFYDLASYEMRKAYA